jgi:hypothetical protein
MSALETPTPLAVSKRGRKKLVIDFHTHILPRELPDFEVSCAADGAIGLNQIGLLQFRQRNNVIPQWNVRLKRVRLISTLVSVTAQ